MTERTEPMPFHGGASGAFPTLVLAEDETDMWLATVPFAEPPAEGALFHFRGEVWQVVWVDPSGCRAEPVLM